MFLNSFKRGYEHTKCPVLTEILEDNKKNPSLSSFNEREAPKICSTRDVRYEREASRNFCNTRSVWF